MIWSQSVLRRPYKIELDELLRRQSRRESTARSYPRRLPISMCRGKGPYIEDSRGQVYFDCLCGAGAVPLGHSHPVIIDAIQRVLSDAEPLTILDFPSRTKDDFTSEVISALPAKIRRRARIQFCGPSGADAVEAALKLVRIATGKPIICHFEGAYHGMTLGALSVSGIPVKRKLGISFGDVVSFPYPRSSEDAARRHPAPDERESLAHIEHVFSATRSGVREIGGVIVEVIQGEGGVVAPSSTWLVGLRALSRKYGIALIVDEIQTGVGRTGNMFAFEYASIEPDVIIASKAIGGGLPMALVIYDKDLDKWGPGDHAGTFRGNQLAMAAGAATLRFIRDKGILANVNIVGAAMKLRLEQTAKRSSFISDVRGRGLMLGVEIVAKKCDDEGNVAITKRIQYEALRRGLIVETLGRRKNVIRFMPPLNLKHLEAENICSIFEEAVVAAEG